MKNIKVHWCYFKNFGDALNPYIIKKISGKKVVYRNLIHPNWFSELRLILHSIMHFEIYDFNRLSFPNKQKKVILGIGSLLSRSKNNCIVWGSGFMNESEIAEGGEFKAVRGRFSAEKLRKLGFDFCKVWGDPALLLPLVYSKKTEKKYFIGLIPHLRDSFDFQIKYSDKFKVINLETDNIEQVIDEILECDYIFSTSLHGIIVSHAYNIPAIWVEHNYINTDGIKFRDYFDSVGIVPYKAFRLENDIILDEERIKNFFNINSDKAKINNSLVKIQKQLLKVSPFPLQNNFLDFLNI